MAADALILVFAKAPEPGQVKTRLIPTMGAEGAALLHAALTERVLTTACATGFPVQLCVAPDCDHAFFQSCAEDFEVTLAPQLAVDDLGARMLHALNSALKSHKRALLIGADCPSLAAKHLKEAARQLESHDVVLTPAEDGGYVLIGARRTDSAMFRDIVWSRADVLARQRTALSAAGLGWHEMETLWDVDRVEDLAKLKTLKPPFEFFWPA